MMQSSFFLQQHIQNNPTDLLLQLGIAGCFNPSLPLGSTWIVEREYLGSLGVVENNAELLNNQQQNEQWQDIFDLGLQQQNTPPFQKKALMNPHIPNWPWLPMDNLGLATGITVDEISTSPGRIATLKRHYANAEHPARPILESMEGASLHFTALQHQIPFLQLRGISNYTGQRDKSYWNIPLAIKEVTKVAIAVMGML